MKALLYKLLGKFISHDHKVLKIVEQHREPGYYAYHIEMDCHVQPIKIILMTRPISEGDSFDPHFSNPFVVARFKPTEEGFENAKKLMFMLKPEND
jgi:hypothetical protein